MSNPVSTTSSASQAAPSTAGPDVSELLRRVEELRPLLEEQAEAAEAQGRLTDEVATALSTAGVLAMWAPRSLGGSELAPTESLRVLERLAAVDASAAWVSMATGLAIGTGAAYLGDDAVQRIFAGGRFPGIAGQGTRPGKAVPVEGGYRLSGAWSFASGIKHAEYVHTGAKNTETGEALICVLPVGQADLIETWDVMGLRATGSIDYTIDDVFVPAAYTHSATAGRSDRGGSLYRFGPMNIALISHAGWALGVGRRVLDELSGLVTSKVGRPGDLSASSAFQADYAAAEAKLRAARAFVFEVWGDAEQTLERGEELSVRQQTLLRLVLQHATWQVHEVVQFVYRNGGTTALRRGVIQRYFRDMHAGTQHITSGPAALQACGRELVGVAEGQSWQMLALVDGA